MSKHQNSAVFRKTKKGLTIDEISDEDGWKEVKNSLLTNVGTNPLPVIYVEEIECDGTLILRHEHDGRDLEIPYANKVLGYIAELWGDEIKMDSIIEDEKWEF